jgi:hypothetical protein
MIISASELFISPSDYTAVGLTRLLKKGKVKCCKVGLIFMGIIQQKKKKKILF